MSHTPPSTAATVMATAVRLMLVIELLKLDATA